VSEGPVERLWAAIQARDWVAAREQLAENVTIDWPATGERFSGRDRYLEVQRIYPEGWSIEVRAVVHEGSRVAIEARVPHGDEVFFCAAFYELEDGVITRGVEHWSDGRASPAPGWRDHLAEPLPGR
jgi:SnoaL-like domain